MTGVRTEPDTSRLSEQHMGLMDLLEEWEDLHQLGKSLTRYLDPSKLDSGSRGDGNPPHF